MTHTKHLTDPLTILCEPKKAKQPIKHLHFLYLPCEIAHVACTHYKSYLA